MHSRRPNTLVIPIIGDPVAQVATPDLWNREFEANGINAVCVPIHLKSSGLEQFVDWVRHAENIPGFLSTVPHKANLSKMCDVQRGEVDVIGAANTVRKNKDGQLECAMFDGVGMVSAIQSTGADFEAASVLIIGAGAAGGAIAYEALQKGAKMVSMKDPSIETLARLTARLSSIFPDRIIQAAESKLSSYQIIVNASPAGSSPNDPLPIQLSGASTQAVIADAITEPGETHFLKLAREIGLKTVTGQEMAAAQASPMREYLGISTQ